MEPAVKRLGVGFLIPSERIALVAAELSSRCSEHGAYALHLRIAHDDRGRALLITDDEQQLLERFVKKSVFSHHLEPVCFVERGAQIKAFR